MASHCSSPPHPQGVVVSAATGEDTRITVEETACFHSNSSMAKRKYDSEYIKYGFSYIEDKGVQKHASE